MRQRRTFRARLGERDSVVRFEAVAQVRLIVKAEFFDAIERVKSGLQAFLPKQLVAEKTERLRGRRSDRPQEFPLKRPRADGAETRGGKNAFERKGHTDSIAHSSEKMYNVFDSCEGESS